MVQYSMAENIHFQVIDGEAILLDLQTDQYYRLNEVATDVWCEITRGTEMSSVLGTLEQKYEVEPNQLRSDVEKLIQLFRHLGLLSSEQSQLHE